MQNLYLLYHQVRAQPSDYTYAIASARLGEHLDLCRALQHRDDGGPVPAITFDDGHASDLEFALPALADRGLHARFFVTAGWTSQRSGYMSWEGVRTLHAAGHTVGAHGWSHRLLTHCSPEELREELERPRQALEDALGVAVTEMSLPGGRCNRHVLAACSAAGYTRVFTSEPRLEPPAAGGLTCGRFNILGSLSAAALERLLAPGSRDLAAAMRSARLKGAAQSLLGDRLYAGLWALVNRHEAGSASNAAEPEHLGQGAR